MPRTHEPGLQIGLILILWGLDLEASDDPSSVGSHRFRMDCCSAFVAEQAARRVAGVSLEDIVEARRKSQNA